MLLLLAMTLPVLRRRRRLGHQHPGRLGIRHRQLRVVDRYRPRRHADLRHSCSAQAELAQLDQSFRRSHDAVRRACAGMFPVLHTGRPWLAYWLFPYPNTMGVWPQFRSPLVWDVFAVSTYATVSALFWYVGLVPDFATMRDTREASGPRCIYGMLAMGWRGSARHWKRYETAYLLLAGLATPLVLSVHTVVSFDFAISHHAGMAHHHLPAVFRCRRHLFRLRHGAVPRDPDPHVLRIGRPDHHASPGSTRPR